MLTHTGMTPLHHAVAHSRCVALLLEKEAKVDLQDALGRTPLYFCLKHSFSDSAKVLLAKGRLIVFVVVGRCSVLLVAGVCVVVVVAKIPGTQ